MEAIKDQQINYFTKLLVSEPPKNRQKEQIIQDYLESHSDMIPLNMILNHNVLYDFIFSKLPINSSCISDLCYITKSSVEYRIVLIELESPDKKIFTNNLSKMIFSSEFNAALQQIRDWKISLENDKSEILRILSPMLRMQREYNDPISFAYQLIIGRSFEYSNNEKKKKNILKIKEETDIDIMTYDSLINWYKNDYKNWYKNIIKYEKGRYSIKIMDAMQQVFFANLTPADISLTKKQRELLILENYQIKDWENNIPLVVNCKYTSPEQLYKLENGHCT
ncbi:MAG: DUF4263 domain-containing protein [Spirochaetaceae bacterium]|jgi:hypothetical protein|nr:DUF4263 domain-containing protein [Spirochaetaceae bacterium]